MFPACKWSKCPLIMELPLDGTELLKRYGLVHQLMRHKHSMFHPQEDRAEGRKRRLADFED
jgi:hypothetical protein